MFVGELRQVSSGSNRRHPVRRGWPERMARIGRSAPSGRWLLLHARGTLS
jgi:hypothetical protein